MYITDKFIYIEIQKTGSTHITKLLNQICNGQARRKHSIPTQKEKRGDIPFISSIRNPWEWYLSLWIYGCQNRGGLRKRLTSVCLPSKTLIFQPKHLVLWHLTNTFSDKEIWRYCYEDQNDASRFKTWLNMIHNKKYKFSHGDGYGPSGLQPFVGFYTYRYLIHSCSNINKAKENPENLKEFDKKNCFVSYWIRTESLEEDLYKYLTETGMADEELIKKKFGSSTKTNSSGERPKTSLFYDKESKEIVRKMDRLIIDKFNYNFPE